MGNTCCSGRVKKGHSPPALETLEKRVTHQNTVSTTTTRGRTKSFSRASSAIGKKKTLSRKSTSPLTTKKTSGKTATVAADNVPVSPESMQKPPEAALASMRFLSNSPLQPLREEDTLDDFTLNLNYALESARDCSVSQQQQMLDLFEAEESLDGLISVSILSGELREQVLVFALTSKNVWILSGFDYGNAKLKLSLSSIRLICITKDRTVFALVYKPESGTGLEHLVMSCFRVEDLLKALVSVICEESGKLLPSITLPSLDEMLSYILRLSWPALNDLNSASFARILFVFYSHGFIGENKSLAIQCMYETDGVEKGVQLVVSDRAIYILSYDYELLRRVRLSEVTAVSYRDATHMTVAAEEEFTFIVPPRQIQALEETIKAFRKRASTL